MYKKQLLAILLLSFSILFGACSRSDADKSSVNTGKDSNLIVENENSGEKDKKSGGKVTVISQKDEGIVLVRSTRFR